MKPKDNKTEKQAQHEYERREVRRRLWLRVAAIFLVIAFLASECSTLLPIE